MNIFKKSVACCFVTLAVLGSLWGQSRIVARKPSGDEYWYILMQAQEAFDYSDYGRAVSLAEQAKNKRKALIEWEKYTLDQAQMSSSVRLAGDDLGLVQDSMKKSKLNNAYDIMNSYVNTYGKNRFNGKFSTLLSFIERNDSYPEADYLIGKVYKVEGELKKAETYMKKAYGNFDLLSVPDVKYDILYDMADIADGQLDAMNYGQYLSSMKTPGYYADYEKYMTDILADDKLYSNSQFMKSMTNVIAAKDRKAMDRFFDLYRSDVDRSLEALVGLAAYYRKSALYVQSEKELLAEQMKALRCSALGCIIAVTRIQDTLADRLNEFSYTNLSDLLKKCAKYSDIVDWGNDKGVWELFGTLAETASDLGYESFSTELMTVLSKNTPDSYWQEWAGRRVK